MEGYKRIRIKSIGKLFQVDMRTSSLATTFKSISRADFPVAYKPQLAKGSTASNDEIFTILILVTPAWNNLIKPVLNKKNKTRYRCVLCKSAK